MNSRGPKIRQPRSTSEMPRIAIRFANREEHQRVAKAATAARMSVNSWILRLIFDTIGQPEPEPAPRKWTPRKGN